MIKILNYINNEWVEPNVKEFEDVLNPATGEVIARTPLCGKAEVDAATGAASELFRAGGHSTQDRIQYLFKLRDLLMENHDEIGR